MNVPVAHHTRPGEPDNPAAGPGAETAPVGLGPRVALFLWASSFSFLVLYEILTILVKLFGKRG
jgi:hypothetical protein